MINELENKIEDAHERALRAETTEFDVPYFAARETKEDFVNACDTMKLLLGNEETSIHLEAFGVNQATQFDLVALIYRSLAELEK